MKRRISIIIGVLWTLFCVFGYLLSAQRGSGNHNYTSLNTYTTDGDGNYAYISDNVGRGGILYRYTLDGQVPVEGAISRFFARLGGNEPDPAYTPVAVSGILSTWADSDLKGLSFYKTDYYDGLYALAGIPVVKDKEKVLAYQILWINEAMEAEQQTPMFVFGNSQKLSGFEVDDDAMYVTTLSTSGQEAYVYQIPFSRLADVKEEGGAVVRLARESSTFLTVTQTSKSGGENSGVYMEPELVQIREAEGGRFFADAVYDNGVIFVRYDNAAPEERFAVSRPGAELFYGMRLTFLQRVRTSPVNVAWWIFALVAGLALLVVLPILLAHRRRAVYMMLITELVLAAMVFGGFWLTVWQIDEVRDEGYEKYAAYAVASVATDFTSVTDMQAADFYDSSTYISLQEGMADQVRLSQSGAHFRDIVFADLDSGTVYVSASGHNRESLDLLYGNDSWILATTTADSANAMVREAQIQGEDHRIVGVHSIGSGTPGLAVVGIADFGAREEDFWGNYLRVFLLSLAVFLIASVLCFLFFFWQSRDLRRLAKALRTLAEGSDDINKPQVIGRDVSQMWNSIFEIGKNIRMTNRARYLTYEAYYRFAPKGIETILGKDSITEVTGGDAVQIQGTVALLSTTGQKTSDQREIEHMNHLMRSVERFQEGRGGIYVSNDNDFSKMKLLFLEESQETVSFGVELLHDMREWQHKEFPNTSVILHFAPFVYGIVGTEKQGSAFFSSPEIEELEQYVQWFRELRLSLLVSDTVREHEEIISEMRYIGFVACQNSPEGRINLYEVLDACATRVRQAKIRTRKRFEDAIQLFYNKDFYLARNSFTEILRELPEDELVTWYLFECERFLNDDSGVPDFTGELRVPKD